MQGLEAEHYDGTKEYSVLEWLVPEGLHSLLSRIGQRWYNKHAILVEYVPNLLHWTRIKSFIGCHAGLSQHDHTVPHIYDCYFAGVVPKAI